MNMLRAQVSIEFLLLLILAFSLLTISLYFLSSLSSTSSLLVKKAAFLRESVFLKEILLEVCYLGDGNVRTINLPYELFISSDGEEVYIYSGNSTLSFTMPCDLVTKESLQGKIKIENVDNTIKVLVE